MTPSPDVQTWCRSKDNNKEGAAYGKYYVSIKDACIYRFETYFSGLNYVFALSSALTFLVQEQSI